MHYYPGYIHCRSATSGAGDGGADSGSVQQLPGGGGGVLGGTSNARWRGSTGRCSVTGGVGRGSSLIGSLSAAGDNEDSGGDSSMSDERDESDSNSGASGLEPPDPQLPYPGIARLSMGYLTQTTRPRSWCLALITNPWFERVSMIIILLNCVTLGMYQPCVDFKCISNYRCQILQVFDGFIFAFFSLEMTVKMVAMGVWGRGTYLADSWNRLDLFIVLAGGLEYCLNVQNINLSAIRTIRVLRPLRAINRIPSMRILVMLLLDTLPMLGNVLLLCFFVFFIFGIVGVQLWQGILRQRCFMGNANYTLPSDLSHYYNVPQETEYICSKKEHSGMHLCSDLPPLRVNNITCTLTYEEFHSSIASLASGGCINWNQYYVNCIEGDSNPAMGTISFDNIGLAWVAIFLVISLEGWSEIMYNVQDAHSFWDWIYFVLLIVIGSFFMINLCLVVIATQFSETKKREMERMRLERARFQSSSTLASSTNNSEPSSCYAEIVKYIAHIWRKGRRKLIKRVRLLRYRREQRREQKIVSGETIRLNCNSVRGHHPRCPKLRQHQQMISNSSQASSMLPNADHHRRHQPQRAPSEEPETTNSSSGGATTAVLQRPSLLRVPASASNKDVIVMGCQLAPSNNNDSPTNLLSPPQPCSNNQRRPSIRFSGIVMLHEEANDNAGTNNNVGNANGGKNVCSSEKMTQTGDGNIWPLSDPSQQQQQHQQQLLHHLQQSTQDYCELMMAGEAMTCQELLALGAINAALPTGQIALDSFFNNLSKEIKNRKPCDDQLFSDQQPNSRHNSASNGGGNGNNVNSTRDHQEDEFICCQDLWQCDSTTDYKTDTRSKCYVVTCLVVKACFKALKYMRRFVKGVVDHRYFQRGILLAILINTLSMGVEYHDQPDYMTNVVEMSNFVFSGIFAFEMIMKVIAEGPFGYISNGFNVFDGVIVILSAVELFKSIGKEDTHSDSSGLSVLRTFRLLRILKLVRFMPNLRRQLFVMLRTMDNVAIFFSLLILFIFIFSILGMYLFGGKFCKWVDKDNVQHECSCDMIVQQDERCECDRKHFNNFLWATVTVFQILTQEDWNMVLASGMAKTSHWAALYFVALMTFGNYVLFNLLVAILVEGFSSERNERREKEQREMARRKMSIMLESGAFGSGGGSDGAGEGSESVVGSSSSGSFPTRETKNCWRSLEELGKLKDSNTQKPPSKFIPCACNDLAIVKDRFSYSDSLEPKCNIQKESYMLNQPKQTSPPTITHTAATPQDSPCNTLEDFPEFKFSITSCLGDLSSQIFDVTNSTDSRIKNSGARSIPDLLKPPSFSPLPKTSLLEVPQNDMMPNVSLNRSAPSIGYATTNLPTPTGATITNTCITTTTSTESYDIHQQQMADNVVCQKSSSPWKIPSKSSLRIRGKKGRTGSESEAIPLNNGRDHSQCNGGGVARQLSLRNDSLLQSSIRIQNDTQKDKPNNKSSKGLSPQNSFRGRLHTHSSVPQVAWARTPSRHNSLTVPNSVPVQPKISPCNVAPSPFVAYSAQHSSVVNLSSHRDSTQKKSFNNLCPVEVERTLPAVNMADLTPNPPEKKVSLLHRIFIYLEPKSYMKEKEYSLYIFAPHYKIRVFCNWFVSRKWFDNLVLLFIAMNCITLAMERPVIPANSPERMFLSCSNYLFTFVFSVEMFVKVVAWGMCYGPDAYFTSGWNIMDGSLVVISIVDLLMSLLSESSPRIFGILRVFRLLRSLRPLRVINRAPGLKLVVQTLLSSLRPIGNIVLICCTFFIIFGILGVQLFKGTFFYCKGDNNRDVHNRTECIDKGNEWVNQEYNFDHLGRALMSLFVLSSRDGWVNIMYTGIDAVGVDQQPVVNFSEWRLLYFISFILLVGFFVLNMFVGVVVENFHRCREEQEKEERIRRAAKRALQMEKRRKKMNEPPYYINYGQWRMFIHGVVTSKYFDLAIAAVIGLNVVTMATESYKMPDILSYVLKIFNYFFTAVFILESSMKLIALGFLLYMKEKWNQLDVLIVILSVVGIILEELKSNIIPINPTVLRVMRVMRIARVLKLLKMAKGIRALLDTVMQALPQVGNLGLLFFLLFFIFAALGVELFGRLDCKDFPCQGLGEHADFSNFGMAFLTLFRVATGDNWNGIMKDTLRTPCDEHVDCVKNCCISPIIAPIFFVIFVLMAQFVLVNVVVAVLMKHLEESHKHLEDEQDMDIQLEREFQEKQEMEERELSLALQLDSECLQPHYKPLTKVLSLPSNFTYNPPGSKPPPSPSANATCNRRPHHNRIRRQTMHCQHPLNLLSTMVDIRDIDESTNDIYTVRNQAESNNYDDISVDAAETIAVPQVKVAPPVVQSSNMLLTVPTERKPLPKLYGSTKFLFQSKSVDEDESEETPFLQKGTAQNEKCVPSEAVLPKHDSQESVQRIISERRRLDETLKDVSQFDIFDVAVNSSEENLVDKEK